MPRTLFEKVWDAHIVSQVPGGPALLYVDLHLVHEVTSPQAFEGLRLSGRRVRRPELTVATVDHNVPTGDRRLPIADERSARQIRSLVENAREFGVQLFDLDSPEQGIVHVIGPELGLTQPGMTIVCGDSHTSTHGAFAAFAFGIGTSEVEHVLATQCIVQTRPRTMEAHFAGLAQPGVSAKDLILSLIRRIGTAGASGHVIEYTGPAIRALSMEGRMTVCNMTIEAGARAGLVAPDQTTFDYLKGRPKSPKGGAWEMAVAFWKTLPSDEGARYDKEATLKAADIAPQVTWGTSPEDVVPITGKVPAPESFASEDKQKSARMALDYMGLKPGTPMTEIPIDYVFVGACTNSRIEDIRAAAAVAKGRKVAKGVRALVVPGSGLIKVQAEEEGLADILKAAGFEWREPGCSMCLAMNADKVPPGKRCASTSNRNFKGRQGPGARTHLVSPAMAVAAAVTGKLADVRKLA